MERIFNKEEILNFFLQLVKINSVSYKEGNLINFLKKKFHPYANNIFFQPVENTGNLIIYINGKDSKNRIFLNAHLDTVESTENINPVIDGNKIKTDGKTILGADDKAGITAIYFAIKNLKKLKRFPYINIVFTWGEEQGLLGAKSFDFHLLNAKAGYSLDGEGKPGSIVLSAPTHYVYEIEVHGKAAHAGVEPEKGINAIKISADLINKIICGRLDEETTANIGVITGGKATNIVPELVKIKGEVRSRNKNKLTAYLQNLRKVILETQKSHGVKIKANYRLAYKGFNFTPNSIEVKKAVEAAEITGLKTTYKKSGGGSDANIFNQNGFNCIPLGIGMMKPHTHKEFININDLLKTTEWVYNIIKVWA